MKYLKISKNTLATFVSAAVVSVTLCVVLVATATTPNGANHDDSSYAAFPYHRRLEEVEMEEFETSLFPLASRDVVALCLASLGLIMAAGGGIGGGGILVPIYILVLTFPPKQAIPLSNVTVFGGAMANLLLNYSKRHPSVDRPLIDWDLILIMEPLTLAGALVGANLNVLLPDIVIVLSLVILLSLTGYKTFCKALTLHQQEGQGWHMVEGDDLSLEEEQNKSLDIEMSERVTKVAAALPLQRSPPESSLDRVDQLSNLRQQGTLSDASPSTNVKGQSGLVVPDEEEDGIRLVEMSTQKKFSNFECEQIAVEESQPHVQSILGIAALFSFVLLMNILKGGGALTSPVGIQCGSFGFWFLQALIGLATLGVTCYARSYLLRQGRRKVEAGYKYLDTDIQWNQQSTLLYPAICTCAGMVAGLFGVGGGLVKAPLLLALGVHPAVASATSATMILFTTFTATTSFVAFGMLVWDYGAVCLILGFVATLLGQVVMNSLVQRTGKTSYIAFCIAIVVLISALTMTAEWVYSLTQGRDRRGEQSGFCGQE